MATMTRPAKCANCDTPFQQLNSRHRFCSRACSGAGKLRRDREHRREGITSHPATPPQANFCDYCHATISLLVTTCAACRNIESYPQPTDDDTLKGGYWVTRNLIRVWIGERPVDKPLGAPLAPCGTPSAYKRHKSRGEQPCGPCIKALRANSKARYHAQKAAS